MKPSLVAVIGAVLIALGTEGGVSQADEAAGHARLLVESRRGIITVIIGDSTGDEARRAVLYLSSDTPCTTAAMTDAPTEELFGFDPTTMAHTRRVPPRPIPPAPEPNTLLLLGSGLIMIAVVRWRRRRTDCQSFR